MGPGKTNLNQKGEQELIIFWHHCCSAKQQVAVEGFWSSCYNKRVAYVLGVIVGNRAENALQYKVITTVQQGLFVALVVAAAGRGGR